ncbi:MAG: efflux RND transporter periplasmic adaptor subunit [Muribaculaceae bacterium]|nr:efflux RND transporter periplasmic adaptor subunit [Muribaculaceae bacterium]
MMTRFICIIVASSLVWSCGSADSHGHGHEGAAVENNGHDHAEGEIVVSEADAARFGIVAEAVRKAPFAEVVKVSGEVLPVSTDKSVVSAPAAGLVTLAKGVTQGSVVKQGQAVATVSAKDVSGGDSDRAALAALEAARREVERVAPLLKQGLVTKKEYNDAVAALAAAEASYSPRAATGVATTPRGGVVTQLMAKDGEYVTAGQPIAEVASSTKLTLRALLPAAEGGFLPKIKDAVMTPHTGSPVRLSERGGQLVSASTASGVSMPGYIPVYFSFDETGEGGIVPGMAVEVYLAASPEGEAISVPRDALYEQMGQMFVFVKTSGHGYEKRPVKTGRSDGERVSIEQGLAEGDLVVTEGMTYVRLAEQATVVPEGHSHNH